MKITANVKKILVVLGTVIGLCLLIFFAGPPVLRAFVYIFSLLSPFIFGFVISRLINPLADKLQKRLKLPRFASVVMVIIVTLAVLTAIIGGIGCKLFDELKNLYLQWPVIFDTLQRNWESFILKWNRLYIDMPDSVQSMIDNLSDTFTSQLQKFMSNIEVVNNAQDFAKSLPGGIIWTIIFVLSLFFMVSQKEALDDRIRKILGPKLIGRLAEFRSECKTYLGGYVKAQVILMFIIFLLVSVVLALLKAPFALVVAAATAILDALPVFGSGITLLPLSVIYFIYGNLRLGIGYLLVWLAVILLRRILEPKLVSDRMGMNPLVTLVSMYIGYRWWGIIGMLIGPILLMIIVSFYKVGLFDRIIKIFKQFFNFIINEIKLFIHYLDTITK
ncbi:MAG: sporulation integral membrane protein YtvI [Candidatus Ornithomonoglobus sp.]